MDVAENLLRLNEEINAAKQKYHCTERDIILLAVSKQQPIEKMHAAIDAGQQHFAENYLQEALEKIAALANKKLIWHFIGRLQSKKTQLVAKHFAWVHSVDRYLIAERLNQQRPAGLAPLNVCLQVNISNEPNKAGIKAAELVDLALKVNTLEHLKLRGLMAIPAPESDFNRQLEAFTKLHELSQILSFKGLKLDTLSMGMSNDFIAAIAAGSTMLRIGTAIFGHRDKVN